VGQARVAWLVSNVKTADPDELLNTELASSRMRAGVCIRACRQAGIPVLPLNLVGTDELPTVAFMSKYVHDSGANLYLHDGGTRWDFWTEQVARIKAAGGRLIVDYTDNHLAGEDMRTKWYRHILPQVDGMVVPSEKMAENARSYWDGPLWLIPEPIEVPILPPRPLPDLSLAGSRLQALWFGHNSNIPYLYRFIQNEMHYCPPMDVTILTNHLDTEGLKAVIARGQQGAQWRLGKWSVPAMLEAAKLCHVALIPSDASDPRKNGASNNRVVTALALGLVPIATTIESYKTFTEALVEPPSHGGKEISVQKLTAAHTKLNVLQPRICAEFADQKIRLRWANVIENLGIRFE
jgi:hypothetical protein